MFRSLDFLFLFTFILQTSCARLGNATDSRHERAPDENNENSRKIHRETLTMELFRGINVTEGTDDDNKTEFSPPEKNNYDNCVLMFGDKNQGKYACDGSRNFSVIRSEKKRQLRENFAERLRSHPTLKNVINRIKGLWGHSVRKLKESTRAKRGRTLDDDVEEPESQNEPEQTTELEDGEVEEKTETEVPEVTSDPIEAEISTAKAHVEDEKVDDKIDGNEEEEATSTTEPEVSDSHVSPSGDTVDKEETTLGHEDHDEHEEDEKVEPTTRPDAVHEPVAQDGKEEDDDEKDEGGAETHEEKEKEDGEEEKDDAASLGEDQHPSEGEADYKEEDDKEHPSEGEGDYKEEEEEEEVGETIDDKEEDDEDEKSEAEQEDEDDETGEMPGEPDAAADDDENDEESDGEGQQEEIPNAGEEESDDDTDDSSDDSDETPDDDADVDEDEKDEETESEDSDDTDDAEATTEESVSEDDAASELESESDFLSIISPQNIWNFFAGIKDLIVDTGDYLLSLIFRNMKQSLRKYRIDEKFEKQLNSLASSRKLDSKKALKILVEKIHQQFGRSYELELVKFLKTLRHEYQP